VKFAANVSLLFTELPPLARLEAARQAGFAGVEWLWPYDLDPRAIRREAEAHGLALVQMNSPAGDREAGELGFAALPGCEARFQDSIRAALEFMREAGCSQLHVVAGRPPDDAKPSEVRATYVRNLQWAADLTTVWGLRLLIEPLNTRDMPGYALTTLEHAADVLREVARPNVGLQFDVYHTQIMGGDLTFRLRQYAPLIRHVQISGVPHRNEPDRGELNFPHLLRTLAEIGYDRWISAEYRPTGSTHEGLGWMRAAQPYL